MFSVHAVRALAIAVVGCAPACGGAVPSPRTSSAAASPPHAEREPTPLPGADRIHALAAEVVERHQLPGLALGLVRDGELVWHAGYAAADAPAPDHRTVLRLGSVTKVFTSLAVMALRDDGKLSLDDPVARYVPEAASVLSAEGAPPVRVRHLVQHTSGIPSLGDGSIDWSRGEPISESAMLACLQGASLAVEPGTRFAYSNLGMALAGLVVARASGRPYRDYVNATLLAPLGMRDTRWDRDAYELERVWPGYERRDGAFARPAAYWQLGAVEPAGGLYSTIEDMATFLAWQIDPSEDGPIAPATVREAQRATEAQPGVGLGWMLGRDDDLGALVWHNGATYSYSAWAGFAPQQQVGFVALVATGDLAVLGEVEALALDALRLALRLPAVHSRSSEAPASFTEPAIVDAVAERLLSLLADPAAGDYTGVFSSAFLDQIPEDQIRTFIAPLADQIGRCERHELIDDRGSGRFELKLYCEHANLTVKAEAQPEPPDLLDDLQLLPAN